MAGSALLAAVALLAGCAPAGRPAAVAPHSTVPHHRCLVALSGAVTDTINAADGPAAVGSDYWFSARELAEADAGAGPLILTCTGTDSMISLAPTSGTATTDVPFGPKHYLIDDSGAAATAGRFAAIASVHDQPYRLSEPGSLTITRFDDTIVEGAFAVDLVPVGNQRSSGPGANGDAVGVHAEGRFSLRCAGVSLCR